MRSRVAENSIRWPSGAHLVEQRGDLRHEAHVGHLVGLVEHGDGDLVQSAVAAVDEVLEPSGRRDDDLGAAAQRAGLPADRHAADHGGQPQPQRPGVRGERVGDLLGQLPGGDQDQGQRLARLGALPGVRASSARPKARVLPEPVRPRPSTSRPASEFGRVAAWIGNGTVTPSAVERRQQPAGMSSSAKASTAGRAGVMVTGSANSPWSAAGRRP